MTKFRKYAFNVVSVVLCIFVLLVVNTTWFDVQPSLSLFAMFGLILAFFSKPLIKRWESSLALQVLDLVLVVATIVTFGYIYVQSDKLFEAFWIDGKLLGDRASDETPTEFVIGIIGIFLILEATRRSIGWTLPILCAIFVAYGFYGPSMPDWLFPHRGATWQQVSQKAFLQANTMSVFGIALNVMLKYVFLFVLFGTVLEQTGATSYIIQFARNLFRKSSGGPAKVAVVSSGLMGSLSGSAVANTATTGTFTIPLMKSSGFDAESAAGIEAAASSGGALMPPIMGAGAYMMLEILSELDPTITYIKIIQAALLPAILYYTALLLTVHFHARRIGALAETELDLQPSESEVGDSASDSGETPSEVSDRSPRSSAFQGIVFFGSFVILILMLLRGVTAFLAVSVSLVGIIVLSLPSSHTRLSVRKIFEAMVRASQSGLALIVAASCVGIMLGIVDMSGLGSALPAKIQTLSGDSAILALVLLMVSTIILGMGLPSAVCYLLVALTVGSVLDQLQTPPLAAHLFVFYFGMMSMVTPPVALAAYAAAAIAKGDVIKSAMAAFRFAIVGFALPFAFVLKPELLMLTSENEAASWWMVLATVGVTLIGICGMAVAVAGYASQRVPTLTRGALLVSSVLIFFTRWQSWQTVAQLIAAGLILALVLWNAIGTRDDGELGKPQGLSAAE